MTNIKILILTFSLLICCTNCNEIANDDEISKLKEAVKSPIWIKVSLPSDLSPRSVYYIAENDIWIAGYSFISGYSFPRIFHFNGNQWVQSNVIGQDSTGQFTAIGFRNNTDGWAATSNRLYKYDGASWKVQYYLVKSIGLSSGTTINDAVATSTDIWFYGEENDYPTIYRWSGTNLSSIIFKKQFGYMRDFHITPAGYGFCLLQYLSSGSYSTSEARFYDGSTWSSITNLPIWGISLSGLSINNIWSTDGTYLFHFDGSQWQRLNDIGGSGLKFNIKKLRMVNDSLGWGSAVNGEMYSYNGTAWTKTKDNTVRNFDEMYDFGNGNLWGRTGDNLYRLQ